MNRLSTLITLFLSLSAPVFVLAAENLVDNNEGCEKWASTGECDNNPGYMLANCKLSCFKASAVDERVAQIESVFDLSADDIDGNEFKFDNLRGKVTVVVNVASYCGYTESHYKGLVELYNTLKGTGRFELLAFPSNQFGKQEPDTCPQIKRFAEEKGADFRMMYKIDVNGADTNIVYSYLKATAGPRHIKWNFATYFLISPTGNILSHSGVEPMELKDEIEEILSNEEEL